MNSNGNWPPPGLGLRFFLKCFSGPEFDNTFWPIPFNSSVRFLKKGKFIVHSSIRKHFLICLTTFLLFLPFPQFIQCVPCFADEQAMELLNQALSSLESCQRYNVLTLGTVQRTHENGKPVLLPQYIAEGFVEIDKKNNRFNVTLNAPKIHVEVFQKAGVSVERLPSGKFRRARDKISFTVESILSELLRLQSIPKDNEGNSPHLEFLLQNSSDLSSTVIIRTVGQTGLSLFETDEEIKIKGSGEHSNVSKRRTYHAAKGAFFITKNPIRLRRIVLKADAETTLTFPDGKIESRRRCRTSVTNYYYPESEILTPTEAESLFKTFQENH